MKGKKRGLATERIMNVEEVTLTPLVFTVLGGMGQEEISQTSN